MSVWINDEELSIDDDTLRYDLYNPVDYMGSHPMPLPPIDHLRLMVDVVRQWASAITEATDGSVLLLPYAFHDQCIECLIATISAEHVTLECAWYVEEPWGIDITDLRGFIAKPRRTNIAIRTTSNKRIYATKELVAALASPEIIAE